MKNLLRLPVLISLLVLLSSSTTDKNKDKMISEFVSLRDSFSKGQAAIIKARIQLACVVYNMEKDSSISKLIKDKILKTDSILKDESETIDFAVEKFEYNYKKYTE